ncbi:MAG: glucose 1-dehydrogenase [Alphaproteobacteria bacterium]|nr:glucose 1-dehydrogenase [Alphaproteobacteria bacterium]
MAKARLEGRLALVTGGSRGIGAAIARAFASEGARVVIASRKQPGLDAVAAEINADHPDAVIPRACHVGDPEAIAALMTWIHEEVGALDILVNNAATNPYLGPFLHTPAAAFDKTFEVNLKGPFELCRQAAQRWLDADRGGSIINVTSVFGMTAAPFQCTYAMTKAALISMTKTMAAELGAGGIRVNAVAPGLVETRFAAAILGNPEFARVFNERAALGRPGTPEEIAGICTYLASDEASFTTGQVFCIDGGYSAS